MPAATCFAGPLLGIESSCDETAAAILAPDGSILAEAVLSQALRVMAGGGKSPATGGSDDRSSRRRLTTGQLVLLAAIIGLLIGIGAGFLSLMW